MTTTSYRLAPDCKPAWNFQKIMDDLADLYNREHGTDYVVRCTKKEGGEGDNEKAEAKGQH